MIQARKSRLAMFTMIALLAVGHAQAPPITAPLDPKSNAPAPTAGNVEVLSDTKGVDFGPYLSKFLQQVRKNWYDLIPEEARPPQLVAGKTSIEFAILPDGRIAGMKIVHKSGTVSLDRAAWGGITACNPLPPLPREYTGPFLALRFHFHYNPQKLPPDEQPAHVPVNAPADKEESH